MKKNNKVKSPENCETIHQEFQTSKKNQNRKVQMQAFLRNMNKVAVWISV